MRTAPASILRITILIMAIAAAACAPPGPPKPDTTTYEARAQSLEAAGENLAAAREWQSIAEMTSGAEQDRASLNAARNFLAAGRAQEAREVLAAMPAIPGGADAIRYTLLYASALVATGAPEGALEELDRLPPGLAGEPLAQALKLRAEALFDLGLGAPAVSALVEREALLSSNQEVADNRRLIWNQLQGAAAAGADFSTPDGADPVIAGWLELGRILASAGGDPFRMRAALEQWQAAHPHHPASGTVIDSILAEFRTLTAYPSKVALILPLNGTLAASAEAVRDGFLAGYFEESGDQKRPEIMIIDSGRSGAAAAWEQAASRGADFIVGPLAKNEVAQLTGVSGGVLTLALNEPAGDERLPSFIYQFPLAPEDEAAQAAERILADGLYRGVAMVPANDWGMRIAESFGDTLQREGGRLLEVRTYIPGLPDYSDEITGLLHVDDSRVRHQQLERILGTNLGFEPRRRQDTEFIFLAALPADGRQLAPQFRFHYAYDLPVYATSSIYLPGKAPGNDLEGVRFDDMPWVLTDEPPISDLRNRMERVWPSATGRRARLYALGYDAYTLVPLLRGATAGNMSNIQALSGKLYLTPEGRIARKLDPARVINGEARKVSASTQ